MLSNFTPPPAIFGYEWTYSVINRFSVYYTYETSSIGRRTCVKPFDGIKRKMNVYEMCQFSCGERISSLMGNVLYQTFKNYKITKMKHQA